MKEDFKAKKEALKKKDEGGFNSESNTNEEEKR